MGISNWITDAELQHLQPQPWDILPTQSNHPCGIRLNELMKSVVTNGTHETTTSNQSGNMFSSLGKSVQPQQKSLYVHKIPVNLNKSKKRLYKQNYLAHWQFHFVCMRCLLGSRLGIFGNLTKFTCWHLKIMHLISWSLFVIKGKVRCLSMDAPFKISL